MVIRRIAELLDAQVVLGADKLDLDVGAAFSSDMMSDVLAYVTGGTVLLTGMVNEHVIRTAEMVDLECIEFVSGKVPTKEIIDLAEENGMVLMTTAHTLYVTSGILYSNGLEGIGRRE
mgnify:CR=1 FL=1